MKILLNSIKVKGTNDDFSSSKCHWYCGNNNKYYCWYHQYQGYIGKQR